jgi:hypothetical protein
MTDKLFSSSLNFLKEQWKNLSENQLERIRDKNAEEIKRLDQIETELRNKLVKNLSFLFILMLKL